MHSSFHAFSSSSIELAFFSNARTIWNVMDRARMTLAIWTFEWFVIQGEIRNVCMLVDLNIDAQDFKILLDDMLIGEQVRDGPEQGDVEAFITTSK